MSGPNHGTRSDGSRVRSSAELRSRAVRHQSRTPASGDLDGRRPSNPLFTSVARASGSVGEARELRAEPLGIAERARVAHSSVAARCATWSRTLQPAAGVGADQAESSRPATTASSACSSAARSSSSAPNATRSIRRCGSSCRPSSGRGAVACRASRSAVGAARRRSRSTSGTCSARGWSRQNAIELALRARARRRAMSIGCTTALTSSPISSFGHAEHRGVHHLVGCVMRRFSASCG